MSGRKFNMLSLRQDQLEKNEQISTLLEANSKLLTIHGHIYG